MEELAAEVLNRLMGSATSIHGRGQCVHGDGEPVSNLILRQKSPLSLPLPSFYSFFLLGAPMKRGVSVASESNENGEKKRGLGKGAN